MRKTLFVLMALFVAASVHAYDFTFKSGDYLYGATSDSTVEVAQDASYSSLTAIDIPATVERNGKTYTVTSIADDAFRYCYNLATVTIPKTLITIGDNAFYQTAWYNNQPDGLVYIDHILYKYKGTMPNGMAVAIKKGTTAIAQSAFANCDGLAGIIFPSTLQYIGIGAFYNCVSLTELTFPESLTEIAGAAFNGCTGLTSITLPENITRVGYGAFAYCTRLSEVITSAKTIGSDVFEGCTKLTSVVWNAAQYNTIGYDLSSTPFYSVRSQIKSFTFGANVDTIPYGLCYDMGELTSFTLPNSVVSIKESAFESCSALKSITLGENLTDIEADAFDNCIALSDVILPSSLNTIGYGAFRGCTALKTITIPQNVTFIRNYCFSKTGLTSVQWNVKSMDWISADAFGDNPTEITSLVLGENVEVIPDYLCYNMTNMTSITIPASVTFIGYNAFRYCQQVIFKSPTPPTLRNTSECFSRNAILYVPCGSFDTYRDANYGYYVTDLKYRAVVTANDYNMGMVNKETDCEKNIVVATAVADNKYKFVQWSDGNTDNPRTIILTQDTTLKAEFAELPSYSVTLNGRYLMGDIYNEKGIWESNLPDADTPFKCYEGWRVAITENGYCGTWSGWSDGVKNVFRTIVVNQDTVVTALSDAEEYDINITAGEHGHLVINNNTYDSIVSKVSECDSWEVNVCATPDEGYYFSQWSDGLKDICRTVYWGMEDITLVAQFEFRKPVAVKAEVANGCENMGTVALRVSGNYAGDDVTVTAVPNEGYHFVEWEDGSVDNPRTVYLTSDTTLVATFAKGDIGGKCGEKLYWVLDTMMTYNANNGYYYYNNTLTITGEGDMDIQSYFVWKHYTRFYSDIRTVHLPEGMTSISAGAFRESNVKSIVVPSTVTYIGDYAFAYCYSLVRFEFEPKDSENMSYGSNMLYNTPFLKYFKGPGEVMATIYPYSGGMLDTVIATGGELYEQVPYNAKYVDLSRLSNVWLSTYYTVSTPKIRTLLLPKTLQRIASHQFWNYSYLQSIVIPAGVTFIGDKAFEDCRSLKSVTFEGKNVETIGDWAFYNCHELSSITIPEGVKSIGLSAFYGCTYLTDLKLPSTVESIADNGFAQCSKLQKISVGAVVPPVIDAKTFESVDKTIPLLVPMGMRQAYADAPYWQEFIDIREELPSDVSNATVGDNTAVRKVLRDGQVCIIRNGKTYTITGVEIK